ncbi:cardiolipin synthase ClsB [uncultured Oxalicibacterium sp.]|uniref:cardiolipin synthase ClsB n=1 Tax=uncultured Oxalicibacterium sp. TaxID=1168540 RepID=UPI0025E4FF91|nr:cardiolipin synthase ClsB [uncultured Oxalicibacterium sp.]
MKQRWVDGNHFALLENGEAFFPRVFEAIAAAQKDIYLETFILFDDKVGRALQQALIEAAQRGVEVDMTIDGWGSPDLSEEFISALTQAGVRVHVFDPAPGMFRRVHLFRRLHRKLIVIDDTLGFIGGINFSADHLGDFGPEAKQDYSVEVHGPIVHHMYAFAQAAVKKTRERRRWFRRDRGATPRSFAEPQGALAAFVWRDNHRNRNDIERQYRLAIRLARQRIVIANAYFFPGYAFLKSLRKAARRGVEVSLILQGNPDMPIVQYAASMLYHHLLSAGVTIYEYCDRPLHGKVALVDDEWATVGSSNLDPLSLALNLEANVMIRDRAFNAELGRSLDRLMKESCKKLSIEDIQEPTWWRLVRSFFLFHILRRYPAWMGWLPTHAPSLKAAHRTQTTASVEAVTQEA